MFFSFIAAPTGICGLHRVECVEYNIGSLFTIFMLVFSDVESVCMDVLMWGFVFMDCCGACNICMK
jgi:hypothetical protein